jgi:hypothetical protein
MVDWVFFPEHEHTSWSEARERLSALPKPIIVAPLLEPGSVSVWSFADIEQEAHARLRYEFANQQQYFNEKLASLDLTDADSIETPDAEFTLTVADFRRWATEYSVAVGIGMSRSPTPRTARLLIRPPGGGKPVGWVDRAAV